MAIRIFDSYSEKKEKLNLEKPIGIYVCGITPYDATHLGHAFTFITYDVLVRYLRFLGAKVTYVQNVTDIDDDILIKSKAINTTWKKLGDKETKKHIKNMDALNALRPDYFPHATVHVEEMIKIIKTLVKQGLAYEKKGSVYFWVEKDKDFGKLSKFDYRAQLEIANERGNYPLDPYKKDPLDFVLWQKEKPGEPSWDSPWGKGRPGWHIECSAMSMKYLGQTITIHGGGSDLIFPHHEAEIAQSQNYTGKKFVEHWMHTAMVYCEGKKMSKSLGNMIFVHDLLKKYSSNAIRFYLLSHHYRSPWNHDEGKLKEAEKTAKVFQSKIVPEMLNLSKTKSSLPDFFRAMDDDLNTPKAIDVLKREANAKKPKSSALSTCLQILGVTAQ